MDYFIYVLFTIAGGLISYLVFNKPGIFDQTIWPELYAGKKVVVCIDNDAYVFKIKNSKVFITKGTVGYEVTKNDDILDGGSNTQPSINLPRGI